MTRVSLENSGLLSDYIYIFLFPAVIEASVAYLALSPLLLFYPRLAMQRRSTRHQWYFSTLGFFFGTEYLGYMGPVRPMYLNPDQACSAVCCIQDSDGIYADLYGISIRSKQFAVERASL